MEILAVAAKENIIDMEQYDGTLCLCKAWLYVTPLKSQLISEKLAEMPIPLSRSLPLSWKISQDDVWDVVQVHPDWLSLWNL